MSGNIIRWMVEAFNPCVHAWRVISRLEDDPKRPSQIVVVRECEICGALDEQKFSGPPHKCPPHKWEQQGNTQAVWGDQDAKFPAYMRVTQRCVTCGEMRAVDLIPEKDEAKPKKRRAA